MLVSRNGILRFTFSIFHLDAAFPSNAAEIAAMGYMAWATARAEDPNRRLVGLHMSSSDGAWPVLLTFGDKKVMCDCKQELVFAIDCGAKYSYSVSGGRLDRVTVHGEQDYEIHCEDNPYIADDEGFYPHYCSFGWPCDLDVHLESPGCGYLMRAAEVQLEDATPHFFVDESHEFSAVVTNCHHDAYVGCTWSGGEGMAFSDANSLHTLVTWQTTNSVAWATNKVTLVTTYSGGYAITNGYVVTVGSQLEPTSTVTLSCPAVQFLNDGVGGDRKERYYPVTVTLLAAPGVGGIVHLHCEGQTDSALFWDADGSTPYSGNYDLELGIPTSGGYVSSQVFFMKSSLVGRGSVHAALNLTDGPTLTCSTPFQVIEPLRRMVTNERWGQTGPIINPPCLVMGTNAVFKVSVRGVEQGGGGFSASNIVWSTAAGSVRRLETLVSNEVSYAFVEPLGTNEEVTIEARFNNDAIQPRFRLPVYTSRVVPVRAFIVDPPLGPNREKPWRAGEVTTAIANANDVFSQIGVSFELLSVSNIVGRSEFWNLQIETDALGNVVPLGPIMHLLDTHKGRDCIELYFVGSFSVPKNLALQAPGGIVFSRKAGTAMAHELGHALGLYDAYCRLEGRGDLACASAPVCRATFTDVQNEIPDMRSIILDWGEETGRGFYAVEDTVEKIVGTLLMHGYNGSGQIDIPGCSVISLDNNSVTNSSIYVPVGIDAITKNNEDVVSQ